MFEPVFTTYVYYYWLLSWTSSRVSHWFFRSLFAYNSFARLARRTIDDGATEQKGSHFAADGNEVTRQLLLLLLDVDGFPAADCCMKVCTEANDGVYTTRYTTRVCCLLLSSFFVRPCLLWGKASCRDCVHSIRDRMGTKKRKKNSILLFNLNVTRGKNIYHFEIIVVFFFVDWMHSRI